MLFFLATKSLMMTHQCCTFCMSVNFLNINTHDFDEISSDICLFFLQSRGK